MTTIGKFDKSGNNEYRGTIATQNFQSNDVRIVPVTQRLGDNAPSHRVFVGEVEIGAAWMKRSAQGIDYIGLSLDDPSLTATINADLVKDGEGDRYRLIWSRHDN